MGKVISLKEAAFKRSTLGNHAMTVYINNMSNPEIEKPKDDAPKEFNPKGKGFVPFGTAIPEEMTLAGTMKNLKLKQQWKK